MKTIQLAFGAALLVACSSKTTGSGGDGGSAIGGGSDSFAWAQAFTAGSNSQILAMAADASGVVVVGQITGSATFGTTTLTASDNDGNAFVAKLDTSGNVVWAKIASGPTSLFEAVVLDSSGNAIVSGDEYGTSPAAFTFAGTTLTPNTAGTIGGNDVSTTIGVVTKLDASGNATWAKMVETTTEVDLGAVAISGSNVVVAGALDGDAAFGPGETMTVTGCTMGCVAFAAFDGSGNAVWAAKAPSTPQRGNAASNPHQVQMGTDSTGNVFLGIGGYFEGAGSTDANQLVVNRYDPSGTLTWNKAFPMPAGSEPDLAGFVVDAAGDSYALGSSAEGLVLGSTTIDPDGNGEFFAKLTPTGDIAWVQTLDETPAGTFALALGTALLTFGNGDDPNGILPDDVTPMGLGQFDPSSGALVADVTCGIAQAAGGTVTASGTDVYVSGQGTSPGVFGSVGTTNAGVFVAKLK